MSTNYDDYHDDDEGFVTVFDDGYLFSDFSRIYVEAVHVCEHLYVDCSRGI